MSALRTLLRAIPAALELARGLRDAVRGRTRTAIRRPKSMADHEREVHAEQGPRWNVTIIDEHGNRREL